ncbi:MAG: polysaccharide lyase family 7 protein [Pseudomonas sp.]|uniref:polysaccharide lyase family 7 protein n=1 Tax=Pseudomonas sp. TaxID=306 RepID=UPI003D6E4EFD
MIDLGSWNLSIPVGSPPATIETQQLLQGYDGKYFTSSASNVTFWAPVTGTKTANAKYPRTELRETWSNGTLHNWSYPDADNFLSAKLKVIQVPSSGRVVIGQIHVYESTQPLLKVEYQYKDATKDGTIVAKVRFHPDDKEARIFTVAEGIRLNETFKYVIHLNKAGLLSVQANNMFWNDRISATWSKQQLYFKAGVYTQDNTGYTSEGGKVMFFNLDADHNKG